MTLLGYLITGLLLFWLVQACWLVFIVFPAINGDIK